MRKWRNGIICLLVIISDQLTKYAACRTLEYGRPVEILPNFFSLTLVYNPGAAFGMFSGFPDFYRRLVLVVVSLLAILVVIRFIFKEAKDDAVSQLALSVILGGALGNIIDRVRFDAVVDFLDFYFRTYHWPAFNIADSAISIGVFFLVLRLFCGTKNNEAAA